MKRTGESRTVIGTAKIIYAKGLYRDYLSSIRELLANSMSSIWVAGIPKEDRKIYLTLNVGNTNDLVGEDPGAGVHISKYESFKNIGHGSDDTKHFERMNDPEVHQPDRNRNQ